jgi:quinol monooxygenase YgiN
MAVLVKLTAHPGRGDELANVLARFADQSAGEPGTALYVVNRAADDRDAFWCAEVFTSPDAFEAHRAGDAVAQLLPAMDDLVAEREILRGHVVASTGVAP